MDQVVELVLVLAALGLVAAAPRVALLVGAAFRTKDRRLRRSLLLLPLRHPSLILPRVRYPSYPSDPYDLVEEVTVAPFGDGSPGMVLRLPCRPRKRWGRAGPDGSHQDVGVQIAPDLTLLVVCMGRIGRVCEGHVLRPAHERVLPCPGRADTLAWGPPSDRMATPVGPGWSRSAVRPGGRRLTDLHVDHDGWAFAIGVLAGPLRLDAELFRDAVLETWRWLPATGAGPGIGTR